MWAAFPAWIKIGAGAFALLVASSVAAYYHGKSIGVEQSKTEAALTALKRLQKAEASNEAFKKLLPIHQCIVFMRDSGLPTDGCN